MTTNKLKAGLINRDDVRFMHEYLLRFIMKDTYEKGVSAFLYVIHSADPIFHPCAVL